MAEAGTPKDSMFHKDNVQQYTLLTLLQIKEQLGTLLVVAAASAPKEKQERLEAVIDALEGMHDSGKLICPPPYLANDDGDVTQE